MRGLSDLLEERRALVETVFPVPTWQGDQAGGSGTHAVNPQPGKTEFFYPDPSFPFHTKAAHEVFQLARGMMVEYPEQHPAALIKLAISSAGYTMEDFTPEDLQLLQMAADWLQNGPPKPLAKGSGIRPGTNWDAIGVSEARALDETVPGSGFSQVFHGGGALPSGNSGRIGAGGGQSWWFDVPRGPKPKKPDRTKGLERWQAVTSQIRAVLRTTQPRSRRDTSG